MPMKMHFLKIEDFERGTWNHRIGGVNWTLEASIHTQLDQFLAIKLSCNKKNISPLWKCSASIRLALLTLSAENRVSGEETVLKIDEFDFSAEENSVEALELKKMCDLACPTNQYLSGGAVTLVLEIFNVKTSGIQNIPRVDFTKPDVFDTILEVEGTRLYIPSQMLVLNSQFFRSMLSVKSEGVVRRLDNLELDEFLELLNVIYNRAEIQMSNARRLLKLASRFEVTGVICRCERVLIRDEAIDVCEKLMLAEQYGLSELQSHCLHSLQAPGHFRVLTADPRHAKFSEHTRQAIIKRMISIMEKSEDDDSLSDSINSDNSEGLLADHIAISDVVTIDLEASEDDDSTSEDVEKRVTFGDVVENQMTFVGGVDDTMAMFDTIMLP